MGIALADASAGYGADVTLVLGPSDFLPGNTSVKVIHITTAAKMAEECFSRFPGCDIAILSAAVADFTPVRPESTKISKSRGGLVLELKPTTDIAETLGKLKKQSQLLAGFALETDNELENAVKKLKRKNLDLIVLNSLKEKGAGFGYDTNKITIIDKYNNINKFELKSKSEAAGDILDKIVTMIR
jgi:phosphopantothenoylcysteine decarboxylase/phosphopantothenate--cysteine ligase